jgi:pyochelin synthetase
MSVTQIMDEMTDAGIRMWEEGGRLHFRAPKGVLTEQRRSALRDNKDAVLEVLRGQHDGFLTADPGARYEPFPLTDVQSAYLLGRHAAFGFGGVGCHIYLELQFADLQPSRLELAWNRLIGRHDMLRALVDAQGFQRIQSEVPHYQIRETDLRTADPEQVTRSIAHTRDEMSHRVYQAGQWPLFDLRVTRKSAHAVLHLSLDFLIADWRSIQILLDELMVAYRGEADQILPALDITFRDYVLAERRLRETSRFERDRLYWLGRLDALPAAPELPMLSRTTDAPGMRFQRCSLAMNARAWTALRRTAASRGVTASGAVLAAFAEVIGMWSKSKRFTLNLTLLNRMPLHPHVGRLVGDFTSVNLLTIDQRSSASFAARAKELGAQLFEDLDHRLYSGVEVMRELARRRGREAALMPIVFTSAIDTQAASDGVAAPEAVQFGYGITQTPQLWIDCQAMTRDGVLHVNWDVRDGVFPAGVIEEMFRSFETLIGRLAFDGEAWDALSPVELPGAHAERRRNANDTAAEFRDELLHEPVIAQSLSTPDRLAVVTNAYSLTYGELLDRATSVAAALHEVRSGSGELVAIIMDKGWEQVVGVLGVLLAGAAYLPIDMNQPAIRRERILADAQVRFVLTQSWISSTQAWPPGIGVISVDTLRAGVRSSVMAERRAQPRDIAYVIYTSGSTGSPKGVMISHRSALNTIDDINRRFAVGSEDRVLGLANLGFDLSVYDLFGPLAVGGCLILPDADRRNDPSHWAQLVAAKRATVWNSVPAQLQMLEHCLETLAAIDLSSLRLALLSGDWIPVALPKQIRMRLPDLKMVSLGGATEASIWSIYHLIEEVPREWLRIPYGMPLGNQTFHVLDELLRPCPEWVTGELYIGGMGLAQGYLRDAARTNERFITHPRNGDRLYRTGDLGRYLPDGSIEFLGREDFQVKIRGHRIELGEIEAALQEHPTIAEAAVVAVGSEALHRRLVGFVTMAQRDAPLDTTELSTYLASRLPEYMIPAKLQVLDTLPLSDNAKVDRGSLMRLADAASPGDAGTSTEEPPEGDLERRLATLWAEVLGVPRVGRKQDFFALGGDSLLATKLVGRIREQIAEASGLFFDSLVRQMLPTPTVAALAAHLHQLRGDIRVRSVNITSASPLLNLGGSGAQIACVLVHDGAGRLSAYRELATHLVTYGPLLGLAVNETQSYLRLDPADLIERRATSYARLIQAQQHQRIRIVGLRFGGRLALEMALQLAEKGIEVDSLTLIDSRSVTLPCDVATVDRLFAQEIGVTGKGAPLPTANVASGSADLAGWPEVDVIEDAAQLRDVFLHTLRGSAEHQASPYLGDLTLIRTANENMPAAGEEDFGCEKLCAGGVVRIELPGQRGSCLNGAAVLVMGSIVHERGGRES